MRKEKETEEEKKEERGRYESIAINQIKKKNKQRRGKKHEEKRKKKPAYKSSYWIVDLFLASVSFHASCAKYSINSSLGR